jgi:capsular polysaccharide biosynthesis protein
MEPRYEDEIEIDLKEIFFLLLRGWKMLLLSAILTAAAVGVFNIYVMTPKYSATSKLYVFPKSTSLSSFADIQLGDSLTQDYMEVITGRSVVEKVIKNLDLNLEYKDMLNDLEIENPADTRILKITVIDESPTEAKRIADEFANVSSEYISDRMDQDPPNILEWAYVADKPVGPRVARNTCIGFLAGFFLMSFALIAGHLMNDTLEDAEAVERYLGLNTLAEVPDSESVKEQRARRNKKKGKK